MHHQILRTYDEVQNLIEEGDVLLFRGTGFISKILKIVGRSPYTHVGIASWNFDSKGRKELLECVETRELIGGRTTSLRVQVSNFPKRIDVYRPCPTHSYYLRGKAELETKTLDGCALTTFMRQETGKPYGWRTILYLALSHILGIRLCYKTNTDDSKYDYVLPVCSTLIARAFHKNYVDLVRNLGDNECEPGDIARSPILSYLFTLTP